MRVRVWTIGVVLLAVLAAPAERARAQEVGEGPEEPVLWRKWAFAAAGAVIGAVPAALVDDALAHGACSSRACGATVAGAAGAVVGYMIGRDRDERIRQRWRVGPDLDVPVEVERLGFPPVGVRPRPGGGAVLIGEWGVAAVGADLGITRWGGEIRGVRDAAVLPEAGVLVAATERGLFSFPLRHGSSGAQSGAVGRRLHPGPAAALAAIPPRELVAGGAERMVRLRLNAGAEGSAVSESTKATTDTVVAVAAGEGGVVWTLEGDRLRARDGTALRPLGELKLDAEGQALALSDGVAAVAAADGVHLVDIATPERPRLIGRPRLDGLHFALDVALARGRLYVAGGEQGLVVVDVETPSHPKVIGAVRGVGSVDGVVAGRDAVFVVDRRAQRVRRIVPEGERP